MNSITHLVPLVTGIVLLLSITASWAQAPVCSSPGCNPTASQVDGENTAGGTGALVNVAPSGTEEECFEGCDNTAFGYLALQNTTKGSFNTASGALTLISNTTGGGNTAIGYSALRDNISGTVNSALGEFALSHNTTGNYNTATGVSALGGNTTGKFNTASGQLALHDNATGIKNTALGANALRVSTGSKNIALGFEAGAALTSGNNNIYVGNPGASSESLTMRLGTVQTSTFVAGVAAASVDGVPVVVDANGQLGITSSSARYKQDIAPMGARSTKVLQLRPVTFAYRDDAKATTHYGLIAEEVATAYPELVTRSATGDVQTVKYHELIPMLLNELQRQRQALESQQQEIADLRALVGQGRDFTVGRPR